MDWIVTTARTVEEAQTRALDLLGVDGADAEIQVIEEGKTGLFGRTKTEARVRARIKPKAPPAKEERRPSRNDRNRSRGNNRSGNSRGNGRGGKGGGKGDNTSANKGQNGQNGQSGKGGRNRGGDKAAAGAAASGRDRSNANNDGERSNNRNRNRSRNKGGNESRGGNSRSNNRGDRSTVNNEDRIEMPVDEQRETLEAFVSGVATSFDSTATVTLVEEGTTLLAQVEGEDLGRLIGAKASTLQAFEELARTAMHRSAAGRRYHRIQVDVDSYRARRREALAKFAKDLAVAVADTGVAKAMEPMGAADRKLIHDAVSEIDGVETISEGRDPRRYIVITAVDAGDEEE